MNRQLIHWKLLIDGAINYTINIHILENSHNDLNVSQNYSDISIISILKNDNDNKYARSTIMLL